jgi:hypothetical protein
MVMLMLMVMTILRNRSKSSGGARQQLGGNSSTIIETLFSGEKRELQLLSPLEVGVASELLQAKS